MIEVRWNSPRANAFILGRLGVTYTYESTICQIEDGNVTAAVGYNGRSFVDVNATIAADKPLSRRFVFAMFHMPFVFFEVSRISVRAKPSNEKSIRLATHLGFKREGLVRRWYSDGSDAVLLGMLKEECRWLGLACRYEVKG